MLTLKILFWVCLFIVFYTYIGYGILLYITENPVLGLLIHRILHLYRLWDTPLHHHPSETVLLRKTAGDRSTG